MTGGGHTSADGLVLARRDRLVLAGISALIVGLPIFRGGRPTLPLLAAALVALVLLALTLDARRRVGGPRATGVGILAAFVVVALVTTVPLAPRWIAAVSPAAARLYAAVLPGWPTSEAWAAPRSLALDPWGVWSEIARLAVAFAVFTVLVAHPWLTVDGRDGRRVVVARLLWTLLVAGAVVAGLALLQVTGRGGVRAALPDARLGFASGPFVNPNHFAGWLEMALPVVLAFGAGLAIRLYRRLPHSARRGRELLLHRGWPSTVTLHPWLVWAPLSAIAAVGAMALALVASGSRGGMSALLVGIGVGAACLGLSSGRTRAQRWIAGGAAAGLALVGALVLVATIARGGGAEADVTSAPLVDRLYVSLQGVRVVRDFPLLGVGLGGWASAYRGYQAPPVADGLWDHAHDDYVELAAETGLVGVMLALTFAVVVLRSARRAQAGATADSLAIALMRAGVIAGLAAVLVHATIEWSLRLPANLTLLMVLVALLVLTAPPAPRARSVAPLVLLVALAAGVTAPLADAVLSTVGATPHAPTAMLARADRSLAEHGDAARPAAVALARRAVDWTPANADAQDALADALGPGRESEAARRRAIALAPWSADIRTRLAFALADRGERDAAGKELEEAIVRLPSLRSHAFLVTDRTAADTRVPIRALDQGELGAQLAALDPEMGSAVERGLRRALDDTMTVAARDRVVDDLVTLYESRSRWDAAAELLRAEAARTADRGARLAQAGADYLRAGNIDVAEQTLLAGLAEAPGRADLYRRLAIDVYAARGDFLAADHILHAGERNAADLLPIYQGVAELLVRRESALAPRSQPATPNVAWEEAVAP